MNRSSCLLLIVLTLGSASGRLPAAEPLDVQQSVIHRQPSFTIASRKVELSVTELGGQMAPVTFSFGSTHVQPYHISPWQDEPAIAPPVPVLGPLRGDFFCMPFGGNADLVNGEKHPPHGEVAGSKWTLVSGRQEGPISRLTLELQTEVRQGKVTKELLLHEQHSVVYSKHTIEGFTGRVPLGHHATLAMPDTDHSVQFSCSKLRFGMTYPGQFSDPKNREYQALLPGEKWTDMTKVPALAKNSPAIDLTRQPALNGFADLVQLVNDPAGADPAWTTLTFPGQDGDQIWFALKDAKVLASTVIWMEHHGRHAYPWNGRNNCLGLEDVTAYFADGLKVSTEENLLSQQGVPTAIELKADQPTIVNYIQGMALAPQGFDRVARIEFAPHGMTLVSPTGQRVGVAVEHEFLKSGTLLAE